MQSFRLHPDPSARMLAKYLTSREIRKALAYTSAVYDETHKQGFKKQTLVMLNNYLDSAFASKTETPLLTLLEAYRTREFIDSLTPYLDSIFDWGGRCREYFPAKLIPPQYPTLRSFWGDSISPLKVYHQALLHSPDADCFCKLFAPIAQATQQRFPDVRLLDVYHVYCELRLPDYKCYYSSIYKTNNEYVYQLQRGLARAKQKYANFLHWLDSIELWYYFRY